MDKPTIDLTPFKKTLCHAEDKNGKVESSKGKGYQLDDADGLAEHLGFHHAMLPKVDYFRRLQSKMILIELTDLASAAEDYDKKRQQLSATLMQEVRQQGRSRLSGKQQKIIRSQAWHQVTGVEVQWNENVR